MYPVGPSGPSTYTSFIFVTVPFHPPTSIAEVDLPLELLNEPFCLQDNGHRVSKIAQTVRDDFTFDILQHSIVSCKIGDKYMSNNYTMSAVALAKNRSM